MQLKIMVFLVLIGMNSCSNEVFMSNTPVDIDFSELETYAFLEGSSSAHFNEDVIMFRSMQKVKEELDVRGFTVDLDNPHFFVIVNTFFEFQDEPEDSPEYRAPGEGFGARFFFRGQAPELAHPSHVIPHIEYAPGSIAIEIVDAANGTLLWTAWSTKGIRQSALPRELENYIGRLFAEFPVKPI